MSKEMEMEDYYTQSKAECAALREQLDNMVALVCDKERKIADLQDLQAKTMERLNRTTVALDEALALVRAEREERRWRNALENLQNGQEAYEL